MDISRRSLLKGFGAIGITALFRPILRPSDLVEVGEDDILEEYYANPSAIVMVVTPQVPFRPERFVIPEAIAPRWVIEDIIIGNRSQFAGSSDGISAEAFSVSALDTNVRMDAMVPGMEMRFRVRRSELVKVGSEPEIFQGAIFGSAVDGWETESRRNRKMVLPLSSNPYLIVG